MLLVFADVARVHALEAELRSRNAPYSALPVAEGSGRTGVHAGDRVHPGALVAVVSVAPDDVADALFDHLIRWRDAAGDEVSRLFLLPVERQG
jgi:hypothetical protein